MHMTKCYYSIGLWSIREKLSIFLWSPKFLIRDEEEVPYISLRVRDIRTDKFIDLKRFKVCLGEKEEYSNSFGYLIGENQGWQLDMLFSSKEVIRQRKLIGKMLMKPQYYS